MMSVCLRAQASVLKVFYAIASSRRWVPALRTVTLLMPTDAYAIIKGTSILHLLFISKMRVK